MHWKIIIFYLNDDKYFHPYDQSGSVLVKPITSVGCLFNFLDLNKALAYGSQSLGLMNMIMTAVTTNTLNCSSDRAGSLIALL